MLIALANALQLRQILFLDDTVSQKLKLLHTCTVGWWRQRNTSKGGIAPHENIVAFDEMVLVLQQVVLADVATSFSGCGPGGAGGTTGESGYRARFSHSQTRWTKQTDIGHNILAANDKPTIAELVATATLILQREAANGWGIYTPHLLHVATNACMSRQQPLGGEGGG
jgi:hypothetical protein